MPDLTDSEYIRGVAEHSKDSPIPEVKEHHLRMTAIADRLKKVEDHWMDIRACFQFS